MESTFTKQLNDHIAVMELLHALAPQVEGIAKLWSQCLQQGGKILLMGNGGSAADAQHIAAELVGRFLCERKGLAAIALTTDTSILTSVGNDYGFDFVFSRQVEGLANPKDIVFGYSTSGNSKNVVEAIRVAKDIGCKTIALTGQSGGKLSNMVDHCLCVPSDFTPRIQEAHAFIGHMLCDYVDDKVNVVSAE